MGQTEINRCLPFKKNKEEKNNPKILTTKKMDVQVSKLASKEGIPPIEIGVSITQDKIQFFELQHELCKGTLGETTLV